VTPGGKGQFDVLVDGKLLFSKYAARGFPEHDEVIGALRTPS
jgi:hypothetical protein